MFDDDIYQAARKFVDPSLIHVAIGNKLTDLDAILKNQLSVFQGSKFNVLEARHMIEDALEIFDAETGLGLSQVFDKLEKDFRAKAKDVKSASEFVHLSVLSTVDPKQYKEPALSIVKATLDLEIKRFLQVQQKTKAFVPSEDVQAGVRKMIDSNAKIHARDLETLASGANMKSILPLVAYIHALKNDKESLFVNQFEPRNVGPYLDSKGPANLTKIRQAKQEPTRLSRVLLATGTGILVPRNSDPLQFTFVPETLAQYITTLPGLDVDDKAVTYAFIANSKLRTGAIVCIKLDNLSCKRVAVFDLECDDERGLN